MKALPNHVIVQPTPKENALIVLPDQKFSGGWSEGVVVDANHMYLEGGVRVDGLLKKGDKVLVKVYDSELFTVDKKQYIQVNYNSDLVIL